jgi:hypothetical protein
LFRRPEQDGKRESKPGDEAEEPTKQMNFNLNKLTLIDILREQKHSKNTELLTPKLVRLIAPPLKTCNYPLSSSERLSGACSALKCHFEASRRQQRHFLCVSIDATSDSTSLDASKKKTETAITKT